MKTAAQILLACLVSAVWVGVAALADWSILTTVAGPLAVTSLVALVLLQRRRRRSPSIPDDAASVMRAGFMQQWAALKQSARLAGKSPGHMASYLVLGPRGAGKTTLMQSLGLRAATDVHEDDDLPCAWWLGDDAFFLDTSGRYSEASARAEWRDLLLLVRRVAKTSLRGIILALDAQEARELALGGRQHELQALREQLADVVDVTGLRPPTYVLVTQCDRMTGFQETFGGLEAEARQQLLGFVLDDADEPLAQSVRRRFAELMQSLRAHATLRLDTHLGLDTRQPIFLFPQQFAALEPGIVKIVQDVFRPASARMVPTMRAVYFCSALDVSPSPGDARAFATDIRLLPAAGESKFFLGQLTTHVLRPDMRLPLQAIGGRLSDLWRRQRVAVVAATLALLCVGLQLSSYRNNRNAVTTAHRSIRDLHRATRRSNAMGPALTRLRDELSAVLRHTQTRPPLTWRFGLYQGDTLAEPLAQAFVAAVDKEIINETLRADSASLSALWRTYSLNDRVPTGAELSAAAVQLKTHLLVTQPRDPTEPQLDAAQIDWLARTLTQRWADVQAVEPTSDAANEMAAHFAVYVKALAVFPALAPPRQPELVSRSRAVMARLPVADALVEQLIDAASARAPAQTLQDLLGGTVIPLKARVSVPGAFTRAGWEDVAKAWLEEHATQNDAWVWARRDGASVDMRQLALEVRSRYFARYIDAWQRFIDGLVVVAPQGASGTLAGLHNLTRGEPPPYRRLLASIADNTRLLSLGRGQAVANAAAGFVSSLKQKLQLGGASAQQAASALLRRRQTAYLEPADVEAAFADLVGFGVAPVGSDSDRVMPLDVYHDQLLSVRNALQIYMENPREADALLQAVQTARHTTRGLIEGRDVGSGTRPRLESLLMTPLTGVTQDLIRDARAQTGASWCTSVVAPFKHLADQYPFNPHGSGAPLSDVAEFFRPVTGHLWSFYAAELQHDVLQRGERFAFDERMGGVISQAYSPQLLSYLQQAQNVTRALFAPGQSDIAVAFEARLTASEAFEGITLEVDGQRLVYPAPTQRWQRVTWPGPEHGQGAVLTVRGRGGVLEAIRREGEWGLFNLLEDGKVQGNPGSGAFSIVWTFATQSDPINLEIRLLRRDTPFFTPGKTGNAGLLGGFRSAHLRPPADITRGERACVPLP